MSDINSESVSHRERIESKRMQLRRKCFCVQIAGKIAKKKREKFAPCFCVPCALLVKRFVGGIENVKSGSRKSIMLGRSGNEISAL